MKRRDFLWLLGVISGSTVMSACGSPNRSAKFTSYLLPPEEGIVPGEASFHPSTCTECPAGCGVLARVREGRPVKLEGIPGHPVSDGGLCVRGQSSLYRLYHPERLRGPMARDGGKLRPISWEDAFSRVEGVPQGVPGEGPEEPLPVRPDDRLALPARRRRVRTAWGRTSPRIRGVLPHRREGGERPPVRRKGPPPLPDREGRFPADGRGGPPRNVRHPGRLHPEHLLRPGRGRFPLVPRGTPYVAHRGERGSKVRGRPGPGNAPPLLPAP